MKAVRGGLGSPGSSRHIILIEVREPLGALTYTSIVELDPDNEPEFKRALDLMGKFDQDLGIRDIEATIRRARQEMGGGKVGAVGYCLGGRLAFMTAARTDVDASVGYYGVGIDNLLGEKHAIAHPVLLHIPQEDHFVDKATQAKMDLHDLSEELPVNWTSIMSVAQKAHDAFAELERKRESLKALEKA